MRHLLWISVHISQTHFQFFLVYIRSRVAKWYNSSIYDFLQEPAYCFIVIVLSYNPTNSAQGFLISLHPCQSLLFFFFFLFWIVAFNGCEVITHCGFWLPFLHFSFIAETVLFPLMLLRVYFWAYSISLVYMLSLYQHHNV